MYNKALQYAEHYYYYTAETEEVQIFLPNDARKQHRLHIGTQNDKSFFLYDKEILILSRNNYIIIITINSGSVD